ncbi:pentapeptide repeat-containing protein [Fulvitalea axinellae]|uniref:pentapeptide repeat-containing protein n=1 Tax=Fulvitalea axinellae TaxID=1182444 RepID=UPI0030CA21F6
MDTAQTATDKLTDFSGEIGDYRDGNRVVFDHLRLVGSSVNIMLSKSIDGVQSVEFKNCRFERKISYSQLVSWLPNKECKLRFIESVFQSELYLGDANSGYFETCHFKDVVHFDYGDFSEDGTTIVKSTFDKSIKINAQQVKNVQLKGNTFEAPFELSSVIGSQVEADETILELSESNFNNTVLFNNNYHNHSRFTECLFRKSVELEKGKFDPENIDLSRSTFKSDITIKVKKVEIRGATFKKFPTVSNDKFSIMNLSGCESEGPSGKEFRSVFEETVNLDTLSSNKVTIELVSCDFQEGFDWKRGNNISLDLSKSKIEKKANFNNAKFSNACFDHAHFMVECDFKEATFTGYTDFVNTNFEKGVSFQSSHFKREDVNVRGVNSIYKGEVNFSNCVFGQAEVSKDDFSNSFRETNFGNNKEAIKVRFRQATFKGKTDFENTRFTELADFYQAKFFEPVIFLKTDFLESIVFSRTIFRKNVLFTYSTFKAVSIFRHTRFEMGLDLSLANITGTLSFFNVEITPFESDSPKDYDQAVEKDAVIPYVNQRETFRILKDTLLSQNNRIDSLHFRKLEMIAYNKELPKMRPNQWGERVINFMNRWSNNYGSSWRRALAFIFVSGALFFFLLVWLGLGFEPWKYTWGWTSMASLIEDIRHVTKYFFQFLNPTHKLEFMKDYSSNEVDLDGWYYMIDFFGRAVVGFGYYQFISAFRKLGKG